jgi:hypothetical protein
VRKKKLDPPRRLAANSETQEHNSTGGILETRLMGKNLSTRFDDDDYFKEPNYDKLSDEELDELYYYGELRSKPNRQKAANKAAAKKPKVKLVADDDDENWMDMDIDLDGDDGLFEDD